MVCGIKASSEPQQEEHVGRHVPGLAHHAMSGPSGEERRTGVSAQVERAAGLCASAASAAHSRVYGACAAEAAASEALGLSVGGCTRARRYYGRDPVNKRRTVPTYPFV